MNKEKSLYKPKNLKSLNLIVIVVVLTITFIQLRIIYDDWRRKPNQRVSENEEYNAYSKGTIKLILYLSLFFALLLILWLGVRSYLTDPNLNRFRLHILSNCYLFIVIPTILIYRNENMSNYGINCFKSTFKYLFHVNRNPQPKSPTQNCSKSVMPSANIALNIINLSVESNVLS